VVKTVGDAVMASFMTGADAIESVAAAVQELAGACEGKVRIRVGCHTGAAVVVPLNGINDYFGQTVNVSARVEGTAPPMGLAVTEAVLADPAAEQAFHDVLAGSNGALERKEDREVALKGVPQPVKTCNFFAVV
jgi:class 3 adenylate cyclase